MLQVADGFLKTYQELKDFSQTCSFGDMENPKDGVVYPYICEPPDSVVVEIHQKLSEFKGSPIEDPTIFIRMSPKGVEPPHYAHTDTIMGDYSFMLYLNNDGYTGFLRHIMTGISYQPVLEKFSDIIVEDQNNHDAWAVYQKVLAKENRAAIFDARCIHAASPGFGESQDEARIVLTCFFS